MRLDIFLKDRENISRTRATRYIENGQITVNGKIIKKAAYFLSPADDVVILQRNAVNFVSQGGYKLYTAFQVFQTAVKDKIFADIGASTGGFTDCLLQFGAKKVYAIDVGKNQLDMTLKENQKVVIIDECNAKTLKKTDFLEELDGIVVDVSFISIKHILPIVAELLEYDKELYILIKPQFETERKGLDKHGIVKERAVRHTVVQKVIQFATQYELYIQNITTAPILPKKNIEYITYFRKGINKNFALQKILNELD